MKLETLVKELRDYLDILNVKRVADLDGDAISRLAVKLASYNSTLGQYVAQAEREADLAEMGYEMSREKAYTEARSAGKTIADSDSLKRTAVKDLRENAIKLKYNHRLLQILRSDVGSLIDTLRSRLSYLKSEANDI